MAEVKTYFGADEPTEMTPGTTWRKDDGKEFVRKPDLTWVQSGVWTEKNQGHVDIQGDTMLGPLQGAHGLAPLDSPAFTGIVTVNGEEIADKTWTTEQLNTLQQVLEDYIGGQFSGAESTVSVGNNMAIGFGTVPHAGAVTLPKYGDDSRAQLSEVWGVLVSLSTALIHDGSEANDAAWAVSVDANLIVTCHCVESHWGDKTGVANYLIICKR